jgi:hypothetical protein
MNIIQIKEVLVQKGILLAGQAFTLEVAQAPDATGTLVATDWMRHWNNDKRVAVSVPGEVIAKIDADPIGFDLLYLQEPQEKDAKESGTSYTAYRVLARQNAPARSY